MDVGRLLSNGLREEDCCLADDSAPGGNARRGSFAASTPTASIRKIPRQGHRRMYAKGSKEGTDAFHACMPHCKDDEKQFPHFIRLERWSQDARLLDETEARLEAERQPAIATSSPVHIGKRRIVTV